MNASVIGAIFRRNFVSYFSNPTGYVFICVFVLLSSFAAFWSPEFFSANLANLDQLSAVLPFVLLVFIPAITMSVWAEERRQGTDELLLTIPATDSDVVLGKYLAVTGIFTVSLVFSLISNLLVMISWLGTPDIGLFVGTYFGYWVVGLAMLATGMVASFLTGNLTVGFILGAIFNAPLAFAEWADSLFANPELAAAIRRWSIAEQFRDFSRGVISLSSLVYFAAIVVMMLYLCMVLIGRRHWMGGRDNPGMAGHYAVRTLAILVIGVSLTVLVGRFDQRIDVSSERLSSLSPDTRDLLRNLNPDRKVKIEAYVSRTVPEEYAQTRLNLLTMLREIDRVSAGKVDVRVYDVEPHTEEADRANLQYSIKPQQVMSQAGGNIKEDNIFLGAGLTSGAEKVVIPFFDRGVPVEYELIRSIEMVSEQKPKLRVGVIETAVKMFEGEQTQFGPGSEKQQLIVELEKQYEVVKVDASKPLRERYDALLVVQPSSLQPDGIKNLVAAIKSGQPTALFEDPYPSQRLISGPGTNQASPGTLQPLWDALGVELVSPEPKEKTDPPVSGAAVIWQDYNPIAKLRSAREVTHAWVFVDAEIPGAVKPPLNPDSKITSKLTRLFFMMPGAIKPQEKSATGEKSMLRRTDLVSTGPDTGTLRDSDLRSNEDNRDLLQRVEKRTGQTYVLATRIEGKAPEGDLLSADSKKADKPNEKEVDDKKGEKESKKSKKKADEIDVILVSDIDIVSGAFFALRNQPDTRFNWDFDNVPFVLNIVDALAGEDRFIEIRKRKRIHRTLTKVDELTQEAQDKLYDDVEKFVASASQVEVNTNRALKTAQEKWTKQMAQLQQDALRLQDQYFAVREKLEQLSVVQRSSAEGEELRKQEQTIRRQLRETIQKEQAARTQRNATQAVEVRDASEKINEAKKNLEKNTQLRQREMTYEIRKAQNASKLWAVLLPPIPPLLVAFFVFFNRRAGEREGVSRNRLR